MAFYCRFTSSFVLSSALTRRLRALIAGVVVAVVVLGTVSAYTRTLEICLHPPMNTMVADLDSDVVVDDGRDGTPPMRLRKKQKLAAQISEESSSAPFLGQHIAVRKNRA